MSDVDLSISDKMLLLSYIKTSYKVMPKGEWVRYNKYLEVKLEYPSRDILEIYYNHLGYEGRLVTTIEVQEGD